MTDLQKVFAARDAMRDQEVTVTEIRILDVLESVLEDEDYAPLTVEQTWTHVLEEVWAKWQQARDEWQYEDYAEAVSDAVDAYRRDQDPHVVQIRGKFVHSDGEEHEFSIGADGCQQWGAVTPTLGRTVGLLAALGRAFDEES